VRFFLLLAALLAFPAWGQTIAKPVRVIVPFPAGGETDVLARIVAEKLRGGYAPAVIVENRVGASGRTGVEAVKNAEPDGATLLFTPDFLMTVYPHSFRRLSYDPVADFAPVAIVARSQLALAAGKIRVLATTGMERSEFLPEVPTMVEAGYRDVVVQSWLGFLAPARTPQETVSRLADAIVAAARSDDAAESMRKFGMRAQTLGPATFGAMLRADLERWAPIVKAGFTAED
jgi:tripartite-type tricarboxylate transporter receptor subunit TctC